MRNILTKSRKSGEIGKRQERRNKQIRAKEIVKKNIPTKSKRSGGIVKKREKTKKWTIKAKGMIGSCGIARERERRRK